MTRLKYKSGVYIHGNVIMMCVNMLRNTSYNVYGFKAHEHVNVFVNLLDQLSINLSIISN